MMNSQPHFVLISFPAQGHVNPAFQLAKRLTGEGAQVTFVTTDQALRRMVEIPRFDGLTVEPYPVGYGEDDKDGETKVDPLKFMLEVRRRGADFLHDFLVAREKDGRRISGVLYTILFPWAADVADALHVPAVLIWPQPAAVLDIFYFYFKGFADPIKDAASPGSSRSFVDLPGLPRLTADDLPSFLLPSNTLEFPLQTLQHHIRVLDGKTKTKTKILVNTFDELEADALKAVEKFDMIAVGPLVPSAFLDGDHSDRSSGADFYRPVDDCIEWLDSKSPSSVVYVSFGTLSLLSGPQMEELARGLLDSGYAFLWVIREFEKRVAWKEGEPVNLSCRPELDRKGKIVTWSPQLEVLSHPSLGCFLTHCGWNSALESMVCGVPVVAFPQSTDQPTNAKLVEDLWRVGVRVKVNGEGVADSGEIARCLARVMGEEGEQLRKNARDWKRKAVEAGKRGGSGEKNFESFHGRRCRWPSLR